MPRTENSDTKSENSEESYNEDSVKTEESSSKSSEDVCLIYTGLYLNSDYILLKEIGSGNNALVWMAYQISTRTFIAIKIQDDRCYNDGCREVNIINKINSYADDNKDRNFHCVKMLDFFVFQDDKKKFVCSTYDLYAGSVQILLDNGKYKYGLPINVVKNIVRQALTCLAILHDELNIIHTDIKPENILFKGYIEKYNEIINLFKKDEFDIEYEKLCKQYPNLSDKEKFDIEVDKLAFNSVEELVKIHYEFNDNEEFEPDDDDYDEDEMITGDDDTQSEQSDEEQPEEDKFNDRNQSVDDIIQYLDYKSIVNLELDSDYKFDEVLNNRANTSDNSWVIDDRFVFNCETAITDFGNSYFFSKRTKNEIQDRRYRAPEVILNLNYGYGVDIWSMGCVVFELLTGFILFEPEENQLNKDLNSLFLMEKFLGPMPLSMKKASKRNKFLFDKERKYHIKNVEEFSPSLLRDKLVKQFLFSETEATEINQFLLEMLKYNPNKRATAKDLLNHPWLVVEQVPIDQALIDQVPTDQVPIDQVPIDQVSLVTGSIEPQSSVDNSAENQ